MADGRKERLAEEGVSAIQEAVLNAKRHGRATRVDISVEQIFGQLILSIKDNGQGFPSDKDREKNFGMGIMNMKKRALQCGGSVEIQPSPGKGTGVVLTVPITICGDEKPAR